MSWVSIDHEACTVCGQCVTVCGRGCFQELENSIEVEADETNCHLCGHCIAICPTDAIDHQEMNLDHFIELGQSEAISYDQMVEHIRKRRSHRFFQENPVPLSEIEKLVDICRYAPTGSNAQRVEVLVITDAEKIKRFSSLTIDYFRQLVDRAEKEASELEKRGEAVPAGLNFVRRSKSMTRRHIAAWEAGRDPILRSAPVVMVFHSTPEASTPKDDCVIAAHTVVLTAMTMGLETCYIGLLEMAAHGSEAIMAELDLPPGNMVYSVLIVGFPKYEFVKTVDRHPIKFVLV